MTARAARRSRRTPEMEALNQPTVDFLILADRAEVQGNKLYVMGGGWDRIALQTFEAPALTSFAVGILVPWNACNEQHTMTITIETADTAPLDFRAEVGFNAGRPPFAQPGDPQRVILAFPVIPVTFPAPGTYVFVVAIDGIVRKRVRFYAVSASGNPAMPMP